MFPLPVIDRDSVARTAATIASGLGVVATRSPSSQEDLCRWTTIHIRLHGAARLYCIIRVRDEHVGLNWGLIKVQIERAAALIRFYNDTGYPYREWCEPRAGYWADQW